VADSASAIEQPAADDRGCAAQAAQVRRVAQSLAQALCFPIFFFPAVCATLASLLEEAVMISMLAVALTISNPGTSMPQTDRPGSIRGFARARVDGFLLHCQGALLIPRTAAVDEQIQQYFGTLDNGVRPVSDEELHGRRSGADKQVSGAREKRCGGFSGYRFKDVSPGPYYLVVTLASSPRFGAVDGHVSARRGRALDLMRKVEVQPNKTVRVDIEKD